MTGKRDHTIRLTERHGRLFGLWVAERTGGPVGAAREHCGKFQGCKQTEDHGSGRGRNGERQTDPVPAWSTEYEWVGEFLPRINHRSQTSSIGRTAMSRAPVHVIRLGLKKASIWRAQQRPESGTT